jgi:hypothetical protein
MRSLLHVGLRIEIGGVEAALLRPLRFAKCRPIMTSVPRPTLSTIMVKFSGVTGMFGEVTPSERNRLKASFAFVSCYTSITAGRVTAIRRLEWPTKDIESWPYRFIDVAASVTDSFTDCFTHQLYFPQGTPL